jgi:hypothetical protein
MINIINNRIVVVSAAAPVTWPHYHHPLNHQRPPIRMDLLPFIVTMPGRLHHRHVMRVVTVLLVVVRMVVTVTTAVTATTAAAIDTRPFHPVVPINIISNIPAAVRVAPIQSISFHRAWRYHRQQKQHHLLIPSYPPIHDPPHSDILHLSWLLEFSEKEEAQQTQRPSYIKYTYIPLFAYVMQNEKKLQ